MTDHYYEYVFCNMFLSANKMAQTNLDLLYEVYAQHLPLPHVHADASW